MRFSDSLVPRLPPRKRHEQPKVCRVKGHNVTIARAVAKPGDECPLFGGKNKLQKRFGTKDSVRCSEFRGGRFSEVANVLQVCDFQSVTRTLSALGSVSASRSVRSGRLYCSTFLLLHGTGFHTVWIIPNVSFHFSRKLKDTQNNCTGCESVIHFALAHVIIHSLVLYTTTIMQFVLLHVCSGKTCMYVCR